MINCKAEFEQVANEAQPADKYCNWFGMQQNDKTRETKSTYIFMLETEARVIDGVMNLEQECQLQQIRDDDMTNISIHHARPIVYDARNICD